MTPRTKLASLALVPIMRRRLRDASSADNDEALTITVENDLLTGSDNNYTNGLGVLVGVERS